MNDEKKTDANDPKSATRFYDHPIWYDIIHEKGTAWEVGFLRRQAAKWVDTGNPPAEQTWLEPACGTGRYLDHLARRGYGVVGYDINERSIRYARRRLRREHLNGEVVLARMDEFCRRGAFDFAYNTINTFRHIQNERAARLHLQLTAQSLKPGGAYMVGIDIVDYDIPEPLEETWTANRRGCEVTLVMITVPPDRAKRMERIINHITVRTRRKEYCFESTYDLLTYDLRQWCRLIDASPFEIVDVYDFANQPTSINHNSRDLNMILRVKS